MYIFLAAIAMWTASTRVLPLYEQRRATGLQLPPVPEGVAPSRLLTPLLAVGRAPLVDVLWMRATKLKEEGRFFDALQLSKIICQLQPKFAAVWAFQAWNMAYNISVTLKTPEERWRWVRNGYELLRDQGIPLNPNNTQLYKELAWILFHKVGDFMDEWHYYYKLQLAMQMESILGETPSNYIRPGHVRDDYYREYDYKALADAPASYHELVKNEDVKKLAAQLKDFGFDVEKTGIYLGLLTSIRTGNVRIPNTPEHEQVNRRPALLKVMSDPETANGRLALERYWRAERLRNEVKLDPARIVKIHEALGFIMDFRLPETQAFYWANLGLEMMPGNTALLDVHRLNTNRIEFYCLQKMFQRGRMAMSPNAGLGEPPLLSSDLRVVPVLFQAFLNDSPQYQGLENEKKPVSTNFETGFVGFLRSAILRYHESGMDEQGKHYFEYLRDHFKDSMYENGYEGFLAKQTAFDREQNDYRSAMARVSGLIWRGLQLYAYDEDDQAVRFMARAKEVYNNFQAGVSSKRQAIPTPYDQIVQQVVHEMAGRMYRASYVRVCEKLGITPLPEQPTTTQPS